MRYPSIQEGGARVTEATKFLTALPRILLLGERREGEANRSILPPFTI
jgi:hypothetical protein